MSVKASIQCGTEAPHRNIESQMTSGRNLGTRMTTEVSNRNLGSRMIAFFIKISERKTFEKEIYILKSNLIKEN